MGLGSDYPTTASVGRAAYPEAVANNNGNVFAMLEQLHKAISVAESAVETLCERITPIQSPGHPTEATVGNPTQAQSPLGQEIEAAVTRLDRLTDAIRYNADRIRL